MPGWKDHFLRALVRTAEEEFRKPSRMNALYRILDEHDSTTRDLIAAAEGIDLDAVTRELSQRLVSRAGSGMKLADLVKELPQDIRRGKWKPDGCD